MQLELKTTTADALLGMLTLGPMSGYDLKQTIEISIGNFWSESYGQIYPTLKRLKKEGLVNSGKAGKSGRVVYELTDEGRARLRVWLEMPVRPRVPRHELLLKLFFGRMAPVETMRGHVEEIRRRFAADLNRYEKVTSPMLDEHQQTSPDLPFYRMALSYGIHEARMIVDWCDETLQVLDGLGKESAAGKTCGQHKRSTPRKTEARR